MKADLALSKELSNTPRSKPAGKQYKPWTTRKKKYDELPTDSSAHMTPDTAHVISDDHVVHSEPIQATDEIADHPVVKVTKKKRPQQSSPPIVVHTVAMEAPVEIVPAVTVEAIPVEE